MKKFVPLTIQANRVRTGPMSSDESYGLAGMFKLLAPNGALLLAVSSGPANRENDTGWEHVSVSAERRTPTWEEMVWIKDLFWAKDECVVQYHPPESEYVNFHPHCLHMWKPVGMAIPMPQSLLVGPTNKSRPEAAKSGEGPMKTILDLPECRCLSCGTTCNAATSTDGDHDPEPGGITVCLYCGHVMAFDDGMTMRELTDEEMVDIAGDERIIAIQKARAATKQVH